MGSAGGAAVRSLIFTKLTWQVSPRNKLSLLTFGDRVQHGRSTAAGVPSGGGAVGIAAVRRAGRDYRARLARGRIRARPLRGRRGVGARGVVPEHRFTDARLAVSARRSELDVDRVVALSPPGSLDPLIVRLDSNWRIRRYFTLELSAPSGRSVGFATRGQTLNGGFGIAAGAAAGAGLGRDPGRADGGAAERRRGGRSGISHHRGGGARDRPGRVPAEHAGELGAGIEREVVSGTSLGLEGGIRQRPCQLPGDARASSFRHIGLHSRKREGRYTFDAHGQLEHAPADVRGRLRFDVSAASIPGPSMAATLAWDEQRAWAPLIDPFFEPIAGPEPLPVDRGQTLVAGAQAWVVVPVFGWPWALSTEAFAVGRQAMIRLRLAQGL